MPAIHFIFTGGTIDSIYDGTKDTAVPAVRSAIPAFLEMLKLYAKITHTTVCMKDSRALTNADRRKILRVVEHSRSKRIIITHGTYTMPDTARYLKANLKREDQTVVLTGSLIPLSGFFPPDAPFNLGYAFAKVQELPTGIYVCMNGRVFTTGEVKKLTKEGRFASTSNR